MAGAPGFPAVKDGAPRLRRNPSDPGYQKHHPIERCDSQCYRRCYTKRRRHEVPNLSSQLGQPFRVLLIGEHAQIGYDYGYVLTGGYSTSAALALLGVDGLAVGMLAMVKFLRVRGCVCAYQE